jgi:uncharacterized protein
LGLDELSALNYWFVRRGKVAVAFSGGLDSSLLAATAVKALGKGAIAITAKTEFVGKNEIDDAAATAKKLGIRHKIIRLCLPEEILDNPPERCYICKKYLMKSVKEAALKEGFDVVVDGTNQDDLPTSRPGMRALKEEGILSPLVDLKLGKQAIREMSKTLGLDHSKVPNACIATRFQTGHKILGSEISMIEEAENYLKGKGFNQVRVRYHGGIARIELGKDEIPSLFKGNLFVDVASKLKSLGFSHVAADLEGYRAGSMEQTSK